jgi:hypothetical protein
VSAKIALLHEDLSYEKEITERFGYSCWNDFLPMRLLRLKDLLAMLNIILIVMQKN